jgi:hypothetical protein
MAGVTISEAQLKPPPPAPAITRAQVAFLTGQPRINPLLGPAEAALRKWGRWEVTFDSEVADILLLVTAKADPDIFRNPAAEALAQQYPADTAVFLHVIDRNNGMVVWTEALKGKMTDAKLGGRLIDNFRKRLPKK